MTLARWLSSAPCAGDTEPTVVLLRVEHHATTVASLSAVLTQAIALDGADLAIEPERGGIPGRGCGRRDHPSAREFLAFARVRWSCDPPPRARSGSSTCASSRISSKRTRSPCPLHSESRAAGAPSGAAAAPASADRDRLDAVPNRALLTTTAPSSICVFHHLVHLRHRTTLDDSVQAPLHLAGRGAGVRPGERVRALVLHEGHVAPVAALQQSPALKAGRIAHLVVRSSEPLAELAVAIGSHGGESDDGEGTYRLSPPKESNPCDPQGGPVGVAYPVLAMPALFRLLNAFTPLVPQRRCPRHRLRSRSRRGPPPARILHRCYSVVGRSAVPGPATDGPGGWGSAARHRSESDETRWSAHCLGAARPADAGAAASSGGLVANGDHQVRPARDLSRASALHVLTCGRSGKAMSPAGWPHVDRDASWAA